MLPIAVNDRVTTCLPIEPKWGTFLSGKIRNGRRGFFVFFCFLCSLCECGLLFVLIYLGIIWGWQWRKCLVCYLPHFFDMKKQGPGAQVGWKTANYLTSAKVEPIISRFVITGWRETKMRFYCSVVPYWFLLPTWSQCCPHWLKMKASDLSLFCCCWCWKCRQSCE